MTNGDAVARQARQLVDPNDAQTVQESAGDYIKASISGDRAAANAAKSKAVDGLAASAHITPDEARERIDRAEASARQSFETAKVKATRAAEAVRSGVATASILDFCALLLGAAASWFGAGYGARLHDHAGTRIKRTHF